MHGLRTAVPYGAAVRIPSEVSFAFTKASLLKILYCALPSNKMYSLIATWKPSPSANAVDVVTSDHPSIYHDLNHVSVQTEPET